MYQQSTSRLQTQISSGRVELHVGEATRLPLPDNSVDKVFHMNVCYFFDPLDATLREIHRVMRPGGTMISGTKFHVIKTNDPAIFKNRSQTAYMDALKAAGFENVKYDEVRFGTTPEAKRWGYQAISCSKAASQPILSKL
jgi:SAM-dependent methyltransferase